MAQILHETLAPHVRAVVASRWPSTQNALALALNLGLTALNDRLRGRTRWSAVELQQLADALHVDVRELLQPVARERVPA